MSELCENCFSDIYLKFEGTEREIRVKKDMTSNKGLSARLRYSRHIFKGTYDAFSACFLLHPCDDVWLGLLLQLFHQLLV